MQSAYTAVIAPSFRRMQPHWREPWARAWVEYRSVGGDDRGWRGAGFPVIDEGNPAPHVLQGAACLLDHLLEQAADPTEGEAECCAWHTGVPPFDHLEPKAPIVLVPDVARALTDDTIAAPTLTAANEAACMIPRSVPRGELAPRVEGRGAPC